MGARFSIKTELQLAGEWGADMGHRAPSFCPYFRRGAMTFRKCRYNRGFKPAIHSLDAPIGNMTGRSGMAPSAQRLRRSGPAPSAILPHGPR